MGKWNNYVIWIEKTMSYIGKGQAGNPVLIASDININGASSVSFDDVFTSDFNWYEVYLYELQSDSTTGDTYLRMNLRAGGSDLTSSNYDAAWQRHSFNTSSSVFDNGAYTTTLELAPPSRLDSDGGSSATAIMRIDPNTPNVVFFYMDYLHIDSGDSNNDWGGRGAIGYDNSGTAIDGFKIYLTTSSTPNEDFNGGAIYIFGYK